MLKRVLICTCIILYAAIFTHASAQTTEPHYWGNVTIGGGGNITGIITSKTQPGLIYARTDQGGAYRWDTNNSKWIPLLDFASEDNSAFLGVESLATDPQNPNIVYISTGLQWSNDQKSSILRSTDYGATFTVTDVTSQFKIYGGGNGKGTGEKLQVDPNNSSILYCGSRLNGLFKSTDSGSSWANVSSLNVTTTANGNGVSFVILDKSSVSGGATQRIFAGISMTGNSNNLYKSEDGGSTFAPLINPSGPNDMMPQRAVMSGDNAYLFITYANDSGGQIWKYTIANGTWANITPLTSSNQLSRPYCGISVDPNNSNRLIASTTNSFEWQYGSAYGDKIYYSTDGGANWTDVVSRGFSLNTNGVSWVAGAAIHSAGSIEFDPSNTNRVYMGSSNGLFVNNDITATAGVWNFTVNGLEETAPNNLVSIAGGPVLSAVNDIDGFRHTDLTQDPSRYNPQMGSTTGLDYAVNNNNKIVRVGGDWSGGSMYYSTDQGITWTKTASLNGSGGQVALSADGNVILHCPNGSSTTYRSTDNGTTWTTVVGLNIANWYGTFPVADGVNPNKFYVYDGPNNKFMVSTDGAQHLQQGLLVQVGDGAQK